MENEMTDFVFYEPPTTVDGERDFRTEVTRYIKQRAQGAAGVDQGFIVVCENLLNEIDRLREKAKKEIMSPEKKKQFMLDLWGPKCEEFESKCGCCEAWKFFEERNQVPLVDDLP